MKSCKCADFNDDVNKASYAKYLRSKNHLEQKTK